ncbi:PREDICTED: killer cell lectin-like receptor subfamily F member 1 [Gekko japonicus]|uniref:Killer cell lectin-like receptor subfamily F member 1 n=1 Tax=Gekko japonicus TaxID=146911 RepID=A0ABM1KRS1_GEKJA|nr:PREDICTED: killer cell lectin-like receptor subfamily F member 1 [Gekko japonicus]
MPVTQTFGQGKSNNDTTRCFSGKTSQIMGSRKKELLTDQENSQCKLCQENWLLHEDKCYWASKEKQNWNQSRQDCTAKDSQIVVIQEQEELDFIQSITDGAQLLWIGITTTSPAGEWIWIDGSPLNSTLLQVTGTVQANSCGMLKGNRVVSEACSAVTKWICETEALLV